MPQPSDSRNHFIRFEITVRDKWCLSRKDWACQTEPSKLEWKNALVMQREKSHIGDRSEIDAFRVMLNLYHMLSRREISDVLPCAMRPSISLKNLTHAPEWSFFGITGGEYEANNFK